MDFFQALVEQNFIQMALLSALLCGIACGLTGPIVISREMSSSVGGIAHSLVGGMGLFIWLGYPAQWGAFAAAVTVALILALSPEKSLGGRDALSQVMWASGMAIGIILLSLTPGYGVDLMTYLFGNLLLATENSVLLTFGIVLATWLLFVARSDVIETLCFDETFAKVAGLPVRSTNLLIYLIVALSVVVLMQSVGLILVIALMTIPSLMASSLSRSLRQMIMWSIAFNWIFSITGLWLSYTLDWPSGATIILCATVAYGVSTLFRNLSAARASMA